MLQKEPKTGKSLFTLYVYAARKDNEVNASFADREQLLTALKGCDSRYDGELQTDQGTDAGGSGWYSWQNMPSTSFVYPWSTGHSSTSGSTHTDGCLLLVRLHTLYP